jgi:malic enzyme
MALANPNPEIMPDEARKARPDAMICTGRSDFPNQVNNVLCFPFIFRGALDVGATRHQRGNEACRRRRDRAARARSAVGRGGPRV